MFCMKLEGYTIPQKKSNTPKRTMIGLQIRNAPTLMLPNENYEKYFGKDGEEKMTAKERAAAENYEITCNDLAHLQPGWVTSSAK